MQDSRNRIDRDATPLIMSLVAAGQACTHGRGEPRCLVKEDSTPAPSVSGTRKLVTNDRLLPVNRRSES